jgi:O-methyltransferase
MEHLIGGREHNICSMIKYIKENNIQGDILDIGVFKGQSSIIAINELTKYNILDRNVYLYDTFEGMPMPTDKDGDHVKKLYKDQWAYGSLKEVKSNIKTYTKYPVNKIFYIKGLVEETLLTHTHNKIAYMRLDTDFYSSTKAELENLYKFLVPGGVLIVDDYNSKFHGCTNAVHEFFDKNNIDKNTIIPINQPNTTGMYHIKK